MKVKTTECDNCECIIIAIGPIYTKNGKEYCSECWYTWIRPTKPYIKGDLDGILTK